MATQQMKNQASQGVSYLLFNVLDIRVVLNQNTLINPEMQAINEHNRPERSLSFRASLYKTRAWEELHILSQNNEYLKKSFRNCLPSDTGGKSPSAVPGQRGLLSANEGDSGEV